MNYEELLKIIACPKCHSDLSLTEGRNGLICQACQVVYPIEDDIPVLLIDKAKPINREEVE